MRSDNYCALQLLLFLVGYSGIIASERESNFHYTAISHLIRRLKHAFCAVGIKCSLAAFAWQKIFINGSDAEYFIFILERKKNVNTPLGVVVLYFCSWALRGKYYIIHKEQLCWSEK